jgi:hypothetical protein
MTDYIIIGLLALLVLENSRHGVRLMDWIVLQWAHVRHFFGRIYVKIFHK